MIDMGNKKSIPIELLGYGILHVLVLLTTFVLWFPLVYFYVQYGLIEQQPVITQSLISWGLLGVASILYYFVFIKLKACLDVLLFTRKRKS